MSRKKGIIDYLQYIEQDASRHLYIKGRLHIDPATKEKARIDNLTAKRLALLPEAVLDCELTLLEFSVDLYPKRARNPQEYIATLISLYKLVLRRLAPWTAPHIGPRIGRSAKKGEQETLISGRARASRLSPGTVPLRMARELRMIEPKTDGETIRSCHTMYFGQRVTPSWPSDEYQHYPKSQVKVYIKITDNNNQSIKLSKDWRTRMEVTLNGLALQKELGVKTLRDLQTANLQPLASLYLRMARPVALQIPPIGRKIPKGPFRSMVQTAQRRRRERDLQLALRHGNFTQVEDGALTFKTDPTLTSHVRSPVREFMRARDRYMKKRGEI